MVSPRRVATASAAPAGASRFANRAIARVQRMDIKVLGCHGSQLPGHGFTGFLVDADTLLDAGTVTSALTLEEQAAIRRVLVTHAHLDHVRELASLADNVMHLSREAPIEVVSTAPILDTLRRHIFNGAVWPDFSLLPSPQRPVLRFVTVGAGVGRALGPLTVTAIPVRHVVETLAYVIERHEADRLKTAIFVGDTGPTEAIWQAARGIRDIGALFLEASLPGDQEALAERTGHLTPALLAGELRKLGPPTPPVYLYHMKLPYQGTIQQEIAALRNDRIQVLRDGQVIRL